MGGSAGERGLKRVLDEKCLLPRIATASNLWRRHMQTGLQRGVGGFLEGNALRLDSVWRILGAQILGAVL